MTKKSNSQGSRRSSSSKSSSNPKRGSQSSNKTTPSRSNKNRSGASKSSGSGVGPSSFSKSQLFQIINIQQSSGKNVRLEYRNPNFDVNSFSRASIEEEAVRVRGNRTWNDFKRMIK